jgi:ABC-type transporter Mla MlaB component
MQPAEIEVAGDAARITGDLTFATAKGLYTRMASLSQGNGMPRSVDLGGVGQIDSGGLALLLEWQSAFSKQDGSSALLEIRNPPEALVKIARLCDAEAYLSSSPPKAAA